MAAGAGRLQYKGAYMISMCVKTVDLGTSLPKFYCKQIKQIYSEAKVLTMVTLHVSVTMDTDRVLDHTTHSMAYTTRIYSSTYP